MNSLEERKVAWLASIAHFFTHGYMTLLPAVLVLLSDVQGLGFFHLGVIVNVGYFLYGAGSIPAGILSDKVGSKRMLTLGVFAMAVTSIMVGLSGSAWSFALAYALFGLSASIYHPAGLSLVARRIQRRGKALGLHGVMGNLGLVLSPLFAALMVKWFNTWRAAYIVLGLLGLVYALVMLKVRVQEEEEFSLSSVLSWLRSRRVFADVRGSVSLQAPEQPAERARSFLIPLSLLILYVECVLFGIIFRGSITFLPMLLQQEVSFIYTLEPPGPTVLAGLMTSAILALGIGGLWVAGLAIDRMRQPELAPVGIFAVVAPLLFLLSRASDLNVILLGATFSIIFFGWQPFQNALIAKYTSKGSHGVGYGVNFFLIMGVGSVATTLGGYLAEQHGAFSVYHMLAAVAAAAGVAALGVLWLGPYALRVSVILQRRT
jgi:MFS family permease